MLTLNGTWQVKTLNQGSALLDSYTFNTTDSTFQFKPNEYNGLNRILNFGGHFETKKDTLSFIIEYTTEYIKGIPIRSRTTTLSDTWELIDGRVVKQDLSEKNVEKVYYRLGFDETTKSNFIQIDDVRIYKINQNRETFRDIV